MTFHVADLSSSRIEKIRNAQTLEAASEMGIIDRLVDTIFRGGAKGEAIRELFILSHSKNEPPAKQVRAFLDMRSLALPEYRDKLQLDFSEGASGGKYALSLDGQVIASGEDITSEGDLIALRHAKNTIKVDDFLMRLQGFDPKAASFVQRSDRFMVSQGSVGDCYALATMIGVMSNPDMHESIEKMAEVTADGKLRLTFNADPLAAMAKYAGKNSDKFLLEVELDCLASVIASEDELLYLREKGYDLSWDMIKGDSFALEISEERLKKIIDETKSAETNSLVVNILEHFVGNLILHEESGDQGAALSRIRLVRSESILSHNDRAGNYDILVANLMGYKPGASGVGASLNTISSKLVEWKNKGFCLNEGGRPGFIYVGIQYGKNDAKGIIHTRHAFALNDVKLDKNGELQGAYLVNPWGNKRKPEYFSLQELYERKFSFNEYIAPIQSAPVKNAEEKNVALSGKLGESALTPSSSRPMTQIFQLLA